MAIEGNTRRVAALGGGLLLMAVLAAGCAPVFGQTVRGSGEIVEREIELGDVTEVRIGSALNAQVIPGSEPSVTVRADDNVADHIEVREEGRRVTARVERGIRLRGATVGITVTLPSVTEIAASGAATVELVEGLDHDALRLGSSGASTLRGTVEATRLGVTASGASDIDLAGSAEDIEATASGASEVDLRRLSVSGDGRVEASGASDVAVQVSGSLTARASGASEVRYGGAPRAVSTRASGASSVEPSD